MRSPYFLFPWVYLILHLQTRLRACNLKQGPIHCQMGLRAMPKDHVEEVQVEEKGKERL
jgi:hypothetical protein